MRSTPPFGIGVLPCATKMGDVRFLWGVRGNSCCKEATMPRSTHTQMIEAVRDAADWLTGDAEDYNSLLNRIGNARFVLLGEATHGTHEFYHHRAQITQRLIKEKNFTAVAAEADWPDAYRVNRYVRGASDDTSATEALTDFKRFPPWMW